MSWVTCQSSTSGEIFAVNTVLVKRVKARGDNCAVVEFIDGTQVVINGGLQGWLSAVEASAPAQMRME